MSEQQQPDPALQRYVVLDGMHVVDAVQTSAQEAEAAGWIRSDTAQVGDVYDAEAGSFATPAAERFAVVVGGVVVNVAEATSRHAAQRGGWIRSDLALIGDAYDEEGHTFTPPPPPPLDRAAAAQEIDEACRQALAPRVPFLEEYKERRDQAQAFKDGGYTGDMPARVAEFATRAGLAAQVATDLILSQAAVMRDDFGLVADLRMRKYEVLLAANDDEARATLAQIKAALAPIAARLA